MSHANKGRLKQQVEDELKTLYVCPDALKQHTERLLKGEQGWSQSSTAVAWLVPGKMGNLSGSAQS